MERKKQSLRSKLSISYISIALICVLLISIITNVLLEKHFKDYVISNQERKNKDTVFLVSQMYNTENKDDEKWNIKAIENICVRALEQGMIIKVTDLEGKVVWDATQHDNEACQKIIKHIADNMNKRYYSWQGGYEEKNYSLYKGLSKVGTIEIGYYGPYFFKDNDLEFINTINSVLISVGVFSLILSLIIGAFMAKRLSNPISRVISTAEMISKGYFGDRTKEQSNTREISQLTETINNLAETLEKQELLRRRLTADVAHELRTPLATLQSHMEAMIDGIWKPDSTRLKSCHDEIIRINRLVGDLEKLARYESENIILNKTKFNLTDLARSITNNFESEFKNKNIDIRFFGKDEAGNDLFVSADKDKISQVIVNLLSNALKYTPEGGSTEVSVKEAENAVEIRVRDTGYGIPPEDLPYIFERFYRADKSRNRITGGAGIGLTITKSIVEAHQGKIEVISKLGEGSEFIVILPK